jgi:hypothetical protein
MRPRTPLSWFDEKKLLEGERLLREARAQIHCAHAPTWWEGILILTTDRLFFLPDVEREGMWPAAAFWLRDIDVIEQPAPDRLRVRAALDKTEFRFARGRFLAKRPERIDWPREIREAVQHARPGAHFGEQDRSNGRTAG